MPAPVKAAMGCIGLIHVLILGLAVTVLCINRYHLADVTGVCYQWGILWVQCDVWAYGCLITADYWDTSPCNYAYAVGAIGIFSGCIGIGMLGCPSAGLAQAASAVFNIVWWAIAGAFFTDKYNAAHHLPEDDWRHALMAVCWSALALSCVQFLVSLVLFKAGRSAKPGHHKSEKSDVHMTPIPQAGGHPPGPAQGYAPPPPGAGAYAAYPPAPAGYAPAPAGYPPAPAGYPPAPAGYPPAPAGY